MTLLIRRDKPQDAAALAAFLRKAGLGDPDVDVSWWLAIDPFGIAGAVAFRGEGARRSIADLAVRFDLRRVGLGRRLFETVLADARQAGVRELTIAAGSPAYFDRFGFVADGEARTLTLAA